MLIIKKSILILLFLLFTAHCLAAEYYCDLTLSADGSGTTADPWQWSQAENNGNVSGGDTVFLRGTGGEITLTTQTDANGSTGQVVTYKQWSGQTQAQFTSIVIDGTESPYYTFDGIKIDAGIGTEWVTAFTANWGGEEGELSFVGCTIYGFRSTLASGGDFYPYYIKTASGTGPYENSYTFSISGNDGITLTIQNCIFKHGWRILRISATVATSVIISNSTFDRWGEDAINISSSSNVVVSGCTFERDSIGTNNYAVFYWPGSATGTWTGHEGETITQDTSGSSGIYIGQYNSKLYIVVDDGNAIPSRTTSYIWRLDSDPTNIYWTPSGAGDNAHVDRISLGPSVSSIKVDKNLFDGRTNGAGGQIIKTTGETSSNIVISNNIFDNIDRGYTLYLEPVNDVTIVNNIMAIKDGNFDVYSMRLLSSPGSWGNCYFYNNIVSGWLDQSDGALVEDYSIIKADIECGANSLSGQDWTDSPSGNNRYFKNYANGDYRPYNSDSPQVNAGSETYAPSDDYLRIGRPQGGVDDIGPYEFIFNRNLISLTGLPFALGAGHPIVLGDE